jgi:hypothetical protein
MKNPDRFHLCLAVLMLHLRVFSSLEDRKKKINNPMASLYSLIGLSSTIIGALAFRKPYSSAIIIRIGSGVTRDGHARAPE